MSSNLIVAVMADRLNLSALFDLGHPDEHQAVVFSTMMIASAGDRVELRLVDADNKARLPLDGSTVIFPAREDEAEVGLPAYRFAAFASFEQALSWLELQRQRPNPLHTHLYDADGRVV